MQPRFSGVNANRLSETYTFGPQGLEYLQKHFDYIYGQGDTKKWNVKPIEKHPHPYAAFIRKHCNAMVIVGLLPNSTVIDVGGHAIRTRVSTYSNGQPWSTQVHSMLPIIDMNDQLRHAEWQEKYVKDGVAWPLPNSCNKRATANGLCDCAVNGVKVVDSAAAYTSFDSAYYDGVIEGIEKEQVNGKPAYYSFHDYHAAIRAGKFSGKTFDDESEFRVFERNGFWYVRVQTRGNPFYYEHKVINTTPCHDMTQDTWIRYKNGKSYVYNVIKRFDTGAGYDYVTVRSQAFDGKHDLAVDMDIFARPPELDVRPALDNMASFESWANAVLDKSKIHCVNLCGTIITRVPKTGYKLVSQLSENVVNALKSLWQIRKTLQQKDFEVEILDEEQGIFQVTLIGKKVNGQEIEHQWKYKIDYLKIALKELASKTGSVDIVRTTRVVTHYHLQQDDILSGMELISGAVNFAYWLNTTVMIPVLQYYDGDAKTRRISDLIRGTNWELAKVQNALSLRMKRAIRWLKYNAFVDFVLKFIFAFLLMSVGNYFVGKLNVGVHASSHIQIREDGDTSCLPSFLIAFIIAGYSSIRVRRKNMSWLRGTCVTDKTRLDLRRAGAVDPGWKFRNPDWNIKGLTGEEAAEKLGCSKCDKIEAGQIGPIVRGTELYTPTIKHCCKQNIMAASIRATSNRLQPDADWVEYWKRTGLKKVFDMLEEGIDSEGGVTVDMDHWLGKYPMEYRNKIMRKYNNPDCFENLFCFDSFPKKELQYTSVPHDLKDTDLNTVKERQITGPTEDNKIAANAFYNEVEYFCDKYVKGYCGRKNWMEICGQIDFYSERIPNIIFCCLDGSGFDMTQTSVLQQAWADRMMNIVDNKTYWQTTNCSEFLKRVISYVGTFKVNVQRGEAQYTAEGRRSGDGNTTLGNSMLMLSYMLTAVTLAQVPEDQFHLWVKGDDVLMGINRKYQKQYDTALRVLFYHENDFVSYGLGQIAKFIRWGDIEDCDFLSCYFFHTPNGVRMVRIPDRVFQTMPWSLKISPGMKNLEQCRRELIYSKGLSLLAWSEGLPIFEKYARKLMSLGQPGILSDYNKYADEGRVWCVSDDAEAFISWLSHKFGMTREQVEEIEEAIDGIETLNDEVIIPCLDLFH